MECKIRCDECLKRFNLPNKYCCLKVCGEMDDCTNCTVDTKSARNELDKLSKGHKFTQIGNKIFIDDVEVPPVISSSKGTNSTIIDGKLYVNGYEWKDGYWKRTLKAFWYNLF